MFFFSLSLSQALSLSYCFCPYFCLSLSVSLSGPICLCLSLSLPPAPSLSLSLFLNKVLQKKNKSGRPPFYKSCMRHSTISASACDVSCPSAVGLTMKPRKTCPTLLRFPAISWSFTSMKPQWGAADAEIKVPSGENRELKRSPFKTWSRSVYSHSYYLTARDFFLAYFYPTGPFTCVFFKKLSRFLLCWLWLTHGSCVGPQNKIGHLPDAGSRVECSRNIYRLKRNMTCVLNNLEIWWSLCSALM